MTTSDELRRDPAGEELQLRRRVPRQRVRWHGRCRVEGAAAAAWTECDVVDISVIGAGVLVTGPMPGDIDGQLLAVEVETPEGSVSIRVVGEVRYAVPVAGSATRVGMQFANLSETEASILDALEMMQVAW
ncbi:MAG TPA: PilZ domain-containing protein [Acidimicrobiales bacterium]|nr:PilZ domain-containing protein [Acidimicrobiales bacterium]